MTNGPPTVEAVAARVDSHEKHCDQRWATNEAADDREKKAITKRIESLEADLRRREGESLERARRLYARIDKVEKRREHMELWLYRGLIAVGLSMLGYVAIRGVPWITPGG